MKMRKRTNILFLAGTFLLIMLLIALNYYLKRELFDGVMVTNIQHNQKHNCDTHTSREHHNSHIPHDHVKKNSKGMYYENDEIRFNSGAEGKPWAAVRKCDE